jgi:putative PIG3 family NAD(P)H quinone oxidoreductase
MKAIVITDDTESDGLAVCEVAVPQVHADRILVRVRAAGLNRADLLQMRGRYPAPPGVPANILGLEYAGEIEAVGPECTGPFSVGDRVFGIVSGGGLAEYVVTHERLAALIPEQLDFVEAAAVPEAFLTAHDALLTQAQLQPGERVLIHAVGGSVGLAAVQVARAMGCVVLGTSRTAEKLLRAADYGLDVGIDTLQDECVEMVSRHTATRGVHVVMDHLGGPAWEQNVACLATQGRLVVVGLLAGSKAHVDLRVLMNKRIRVIGTTLRARPLEEKIAATRRFTTAVLPWLEREIVRPVVDSVFAMDDVAAAVDRLDSNKAFGKVVIRV